MIRVVVVDDQTLVRAGLELMLDVQPDIDVVGQASNGREALSVVRRERPDVVLMDLRMPEVDGITATQNITEDPARFVSREEPAGGVGDDACERSLACLACATATEKLAEDARGLLVEQAGERAHAGRVALHCSGQIG